MVIVRLIGGLGNQLFQYAAGRRLAHVRQTELRLMNAAYALPGAQRRYELDAFAIQAQLIDVPELHAQIAECVKRGSPTVRVKEPHYHFFPPVLDAPADSYFEGFFQSERYFAEIAPLLRRELTLTSPLDTVNQRILEDIRSPAGPAISLHVRRTDYVSNPQFRPVYAVCGLEYYRRGIAYLLARVNGARFFVFSDEPDWAAAHVLPLIPAPRRLVIGNENRGPVDLTLMRHCRHHLIANSSFSWWGAWLSDAPEKQVVAPDPWLLSTDVNTSDVVPAGWTRLSVANSDP
jgi:hypothetical protein